MKTFKLVAGIICIVLSVLVLFQSCAAGVVNAIASNDEVSGTAGFVVAILLMAGGIVMISTRRSEKRGGEIACVIMYFLAALIGFGNAGSYADLNVWSTLCVILGIINIISLFRKKKDTDTDTEE